MAKFEDLIKRREKLIADAEAQAITRLRGIESDSWGFIAELVNGLDTVEGKLVFKASNVRRVQSGVLSFAGWLQKKLFDFGAWIAGRFLSLFGVNVSYFNQVKKRESSAYEQAKKLLMLRWGWDVEKKQVVPGGFLANAFNMQGVAESVGQRMMAGVSGGMDLKTFTKTFKQEFVTNNQGNGAIVRNFRTVAQDSFQMFDRTVQNTVATDLGLSFALYAGTEIKTSRDFCKKRNGIIYSREVIESWNPLQWEGKIPGTDVKETLGGYRCRHHLSWLSAEMVELLKKRGVKVDVYD
jgi:hypothetical protein